VDVVGESPQTRWVVGSNRAIVTAFVDQPSGNAIIICAIDNLLKGAAGQAIQAANLMLGLPETVGLSAAGLMP
jgi:N-acetyl-gamma-glutamyl-phosphate reductase